VLSGSTGCGGALEGSVLIVLGALCVASGAMCAELAGWRDEAGLGLESGLNRLAAGIAVATEIK
jgi:hypothetical protein